MKRLLGVFLLSALVVPLALAQEGTEVDQAFTMAALEGDLFELTSSQMALEMASNEDVQAFAQRMIEDHTTTSEQLTQLAQDLGLDLPSMPGAAQRTMLAELDQLEGSQFDAAYMNQQVLVHNQAVALFEIAANYAQSEELRSFAEEHLPALQEHLSMAQELVQQLGQ